MKLNLFLFHYNYLSYIKQVFFENIRYLRLSSWFFQIHIFVIDILFFQINLYFFKLLILKRLFFEFLNHFPQLFRIHSLNQYLDCGWFLLIRKLIITIWIINWYFVSIIVLFLYCLFVRNFFQWFVLRLLFFYNWVNILFYIIIDNLLLNFFFNLIRLTFFSLNFR